MAGKILVLHFPLTVYTVAGFEHSITNLVVVPLGNLVKASIPLPPPSPTSFLSPTLSRSGAHLTDGGACLVAGIMYGADVEFDKWVYNNLIPAAIGNFIGGGLIVGGFVTLIYSWDESGHGNLNVPMPMP
jgi:formate/nitrite transporter FocA (FNT family)